MPSGNAVGNSGEQPLIKSVNAAARKGRLG
jgi:hypothetical protein